MGTLLVGASEGLEAHAGLPGEALAFVALRPRLRLDSLQAAVLLAAPLARRLGAGELGTEHLDLAGEGSQLQLLVGLLPRARRSLTHRRVQSHLQRLHSGGEGEGEGEGADAGWGEGEGRGESPEPPAASPQRG